ncbi:MAG TPA: VCBS repeat-containing protein [Planctomycetota bacterium]
MLLPLLLALLGLAPQATQTREPLPGDPFQRLDPSLRSTLDVLDPLAGGWESEARSDAAAAQLKRIATFLERGGEAPAVFAADFRSTPPPPLGVSFGDEVFRVRRAAGPAPAPRPGSGPFLELFTRALVDAREIHAKFKYLAVEPGASRFTTQALLLVVAERAGGSLQVNSWWECEWRELPDGAAPELVHVRVLEHEELDAQAATHFVLADASAALFGAAPAWAEQLLPGINAWRARLDTRLGVPFVSHAAGIAIADVDGDGLEDLYLCQPGGLPNKLFLHQPDGTVRDASAEAGVDFLDFSRSALLVDLDGDGDRDLAVNAAERLLLMGNDGRARFWLQAALEAPDTTSLAAADVDLDGDLDLYACAYASPYDHSSLPVPYHDANNGKPNVLLENRGDWLFVDVTAARGLDQNNRRFSFAAAFEDYDDDGDPDLYVANDFGRNNLYRNDGGSFVDVAPQAGVEDISAGMGVTWGDADGDGRFDLYVSNMYSSAGKRIAFQRQFQAAAGDDVRAHYQRHAHGNTLFRNRGDGTFEDVTGASPLGVSFGRWAWGALFADLNGDGWQDLLSPNGFFTGEKSDDL